MAGVLIVAEALGEGVSPTTLELLGTGRQVADALSQPLVALLAGKNVEGTAASLGGYGADRVLVCTFENPQPPSSEWLLAAARAAVEQVQPDVVLLTHSAAGRELAPLLAFSLGTGLVTDCTAVRVEDGRLVLTKPVFGGSAIAGQVVTSSPQLATLRPRAFAAAEEQAGRAAEVQALPAPQTAGKIQVLEEVREAAGEGPKLKDARIVVSGGRGLGAAENWQYVEELAQVLGAAVGASRAVTDAGWVAPSHQVGLTGATVAPDLYIAVGISGAVQHLAGISGARNVVAINKDGEANIFKHARWGVVGDWKQVLPAFVERVKQLRA